MKSEPDKYHRLLENLPDAFAYHQIGTDEEGAPVDYIFLEINTAFEEMTGLKREKVIGKKATAVLPGIEKSDFDWIGTYGKVALSGEAARFENYSEPLGRWYEVSAYSDKPDYFATVFRDITEQKRNEKEMLESKRNLEETTQRLEDILSITRTGFNIIDAHYNLHYVDNLLQKVYGKPTGRKCYEYFKDRNSPCETCGIPRALATKQVILSEQVLPKENNRIVEVHTTPFQNPQGEWLVAEFKIDITERKRVEESLRKSEQEKALILNNANEIIAFHDKDRRLIWANSAYIQGLSDPTGLPATIESVKGKKCYEAWGLTKFCTNCPVSLAIQSGKPQEGELTPQNQEHWTAAHGSWMVRAAPVRDSDGAIVGAIEIAYDITEQVRAREEILRQGKRTESLLQTASRLNAALEFKTVLTVVCEEVCAALHVPLAVFLHYDSTNRVFRLAADSGLPPGLAASMEPLPRSAYDELVQKLGKFGVVPDLATVPDLPYTELLQEHGVKGYAYAVLERDDLPMGLLLTVSAGEESILTEDAPELLSGLAHQASSAIANAELFTETQERLRQVQALRNIDMAITGSLDLRVTFQVILDEVTGMLNTDAAAILSLDSHTGKLKYDSWRGFRTQDLKKINLPLGEGYGGRAAAERQSIQIPDLREVEPDPVQGPIMAGEGFLAYYAVPLIAKGSVRGVLEIFNREPLDSSRDWMTFLDTLAGQAAVAIDNAELFHKLKRSNVDLLQAYDATIEGWAYALDLKDEETEEHSQRVTEMTLRMARDLDMKDEELAHVRRGALLHDIGKMGIPDDILLKAGKLTDEEWEVMRRHPRYAFDMLLPIDYLRPALDIPYCHHEKWDGSGYPRGLEGREIPLAARIFAVVDTYDALTSDRPYRKAWSKEEALDYIQKKSGRYFDPKVVEVFLNEVKNMNV